MCNIIAKTKYTKCTDLLLLLLGQHGHGLPEDGGGRGAELAGHVVDGGDDQVVQGLQLLRPGLGGGDLGTGRIRYSRGSKDFRCNYIPCILYTLVSGTVHPVSRFYIPYCSKYFTTFLQVLHTHAPGTGHLIPGTQYQCYSTPMFLVLNTNVLGTLYVQGSIHYCSRYFNPCSRYYISMFQVI